MEIELTIETILLNCTSKSAMPALSTSAHGCAFVKSSASFHTFYYFSAMLSFFPSSIIVSS